MKINRPLLILLVFLLLSFLLAVFNYLKPGSLPLFWKSNVCPPFQKCKRLKIINDFYPLSIEFRQDSAELRTVNISGYVSQIFKKDGYNLVKISLAERQHINEITVNLGKDKAELGVFFAPDGQTGRNQDWKNYKIAEVIHKFKKGDQVVIEVVVWIDKKIACLTQECSWTKDIFEKLREADMKLEKDVKQRGEYVSVLTQGLVVGPAISAIITK